MIKNRSEIKEKILNMLSHNVKRETIINQLEISKKTFYEMLRELTAEGHEIKINVQRKYRDNAQYIVDDKFLSDTLEVSLTPEQYIFVEQNKNMSRTQIAKHLNVSKIALNFIMDKGI